MSFSFDPPNGYSQYHFPPCYGLILCNSSLNIVELKKLGEQALIHLVQQPDLRRYDVTNLINAYPKDDIGKLFTATDKSGKTPFHLLLLNRKATISSIAELIIGCPDAYRSALVTEDKNGKGPLNYLHVKTPRAVKALILMAATPKNEN